MYSPITRARPKAARPQVTAPMMALVMRSAGLLIPPSKGGLYSLPPEFVKVDIQHLIDFILAAIMAAIGWASKTIYAALKALEIDLAAHKVEVAKTYATRSDLVRFEEKLDAILNKLDRKADK